MVRISLFKGLLNLDIHNTPESGKPIKCAKKSRCIICDKEIKKGQWKIIKNNKSICHACALSNNIA